jgi:hypothetical protein
MKLKAIFLRFLLVTSTIPNLLSQTFPQPNVGLKSHETLEIDKVEISEGKTIVSFTIENRRADGSFCADKNIIVINPDGSRVKLIKADGIPQCPGLYRFKSVVEKLHFTLEFPALKTGVKWIDIVEECASNCFWFYGVTLDSELNKKLDEAFLIAGKDDPAKTVLLFRSILESVDNQNTGIEGSLYANIIIAAVEARDNVEAAVWYKRLISSHAPRVNEYIKLLNGRGIKY